VWGNPWGFESPLRQINLVSSVKSIVCEGCRTWNSIPSQYIDTKQCSYTLLCGLRLPEIDGFELCRRMRGISPQTPIVFFSGAPHDFDRKKAIDAGANAYVIKPEVDILIEKITRFAGGAKMVAAQLNH
jgi:CheY-like chemotaxis protein